MSRPGITYNEVANAAQELSAGGRNPTIESIRALTGTGSSSTIAQHLRTWKNRQAQAKLLRHKDNIPEEIAITVKGLWEQVLNQADEKVTSIKHDFEETLNTCKEQNKKLEEENIHLRQQNHQLKQEKEGFFSDKTVLEQIVRQLEKEKIEFIVKIDHMTNQLQEKQDRISDLNRINKQVQINLEHYHEASREQRMLDLQRHEQIQNQLDQTIKKLKEELNVLNQQKNYLQHESEQIRYTKTILQDQYDKLSLHYENVKSRLDQTQKELIQHAQAEQLWQNQYQKAQENLDENNGKLINLKTELALVTQKYSDAEDQFKEICEQNKFLTNERWVLGQENAQLVGQIKEFEKFQLYRSRAEKGFE